MHKESTRCKASTLLAAFALAAYCATAQAQVPAQVTDTPCPLSGQKPMLMVQMFFGQSIKNRGPVTKQEWNSFLRQTVTPRFPDGFTVYDGYGQWQDRETRRVTRENAKVIQVATDDTAEVRDDIGAISDAYRKRFRQQSVAIFSNTACVVFTGN